jgi:hypothetical protein
VRGSGDALRVAAQCLAVPLSSFVLVDQPLHGGELSVGYRPVDGTTKLAPRPVDQGSPLGQEAEELEVGVVLEQCRQRLLVGDSMEDGAVARDDVG